MDLVAAIDNLTPLLEEQEEEEAVAHLKKASAILTTTALGSEAYKAAVEAVISSTAGKCCFGDSVTLADICLVPQVLPPPHPSSALFLRASHERLSSSLYCGRCTTQGASGST